MITKNFRGKEEIKDKFNKMFLLKWPFGENFRSFLFISFLFIFYVAFDIRAMVSSLQGPPPQNDFRMNQTVSHSSTPDQDEKSGALTTSFLHASSSLLLLYSDGYLSSHNLSSGELFWESDTFGDMVTVDVEQPPSEELTKLDPFALPFFVLGSGLYTVISQRQCADTSTMSESTKEDEDVCPTVVGSKALQNRFFANISALLRKRHFVVGDTDFIISRDASIVDVDSVTGKIHDSTSSTPLVGRYFSDFDSLVESNGEERKHGSLLLDQAKGVESHKFLSSMPTRLKRSSNPLSPYLHVVRHNIRVAAYRIGKYKWTMRISQLELSERHPYHVERRKEDVLEEDQHEKAPRFFSRLVESLFSTSFSFSDRKVEDKNSDSFILREINGTYVAAWSKKLQKDVWFARVDTDRHYIPSSSVRFSTVPFYGNSFSKGIVAAWMWKDGIITRVPILNHEEESTSDVLRLLLAENATAYDDSSIRFDASGEYPIFSADGSDKYSVPSEKKRYHPAELAGMLYTALHYRAYLLPLYGDRDFDLDEEDKEDKCSHGMPAHSPIFSLHFINAMFWTFHFIFFIAWVKGIMYSRELHSNSLDGVPWSSVSISPSLQLHHKTSSIVFSKNLPLLSTSDSFSDTFQFGGSLASTVGKLPAQSSSPDLLATSFIAGVDPFSTSSFSDGNTDLPSTSTDANTVHATKGFRGKLFQQHFIIKNKIGAGGEGSIFLAEHTVTHMQYAIKAVRIRDRSEERVLGEAMLHSSFDHPHVVRYHFCWIEDISAKQAATLHLFEREEDDFDTTSFLSDDYERESESFDGEKSSTASWKESLEVSTKESCKNSKNGKGVHRALFILMEYFEHGTLSDALEKRSSIDRVENLRYLQSIATGLQYLHDRNVMHRDLKPTNIFLTKDNVPRIGDFGLAKRREPIGSAAELAVFGSSSGKQASAQGGSPLYSSPEQLSNSEVTKLSDIYSLGLVMVELYSQFTTSHERIVVFFKARRGELPPQFSTEYADENKLILRMLDEDPNKRPNAYETLLTIRNILQKVEEQPNRIGELDGVE